jgi:hypothetical protein
MNGKSENCSSAGAQQIHRETSLTDRGKKVLTDMSTGILAGYLASTVLVVSEKGQCVVLNV